MQMIDVSVDVRTDIGSRASRKLRRIGQIPGILYGGDREPLSLAMEGKTLDDLLRAGSRMVKLKMGSDDQRALIKAIQHDVLGDEILHVDFTRIVLGQALDVTVPLVLEGTPESVREGGVLEQSRDVIEVRCIPEAIPEKILVDVTELPLGGSLHLGEVTLPDGVELAQSADPSHLVVMVTFKEVPEEEEEEGEEGGVAPPEIIKKGKEEEEGS